MTGHWDKWQYNDRNELTHADRFEGVAPYENNPLPAMLRRYAYDPIGNRIESAVGNPADPNDPIESAYMRNGLNQYLQVKTVQTQAGQGLRFDDDGNLVEMFLAGDVNRDGVVGTGDIAAMSASYGKCAGEAGYNPYADLNGDGCVTLADWSELMGLYGYAIGDGVWANYVWDAENRLVRVEPGGTPTAGDKKVEFKYDYMGRRVEKRVYTWEYVTDHYDWVDSDCRRFVYYNWLPLLEIQVTNPYSQGVAGGPPAESAAILRKYTWGLDLAGQNGSVNSIDAAGGIGGLLACYDTNCATDGEDPTANDKKYIYFYDANGNVGQVIDWTNAAVTPPSTAWSASRMVATYEYDPYGNVTATAGDYAADNPFRFSTKYWDDETGLGYWGYRYYSARLGRWVSRDPIEEAGGPALYCYVANSPEEYYDILGHSIHCDATWSSYDAKILSANIIWGDLKQWPPAAPRAKATGYYPQYPDHIPIYYDQEGDLLVGISISGTLCCKCELSISSFHINACWGGPVSTTIAIDQPFVIRIHPLSYLVPVAAPAKLRAAILLTRFGISGATGLNGAWNAIGGYNKAKQIAAQVLCGSSFFGLDIQSALTLPRVRLNDLWY